MNVKELREKLEEYPDDYTVKVDPPYYDLRSVYGRDNEGVVELKH